ncbi:MAG: hypothetical protein AAFX52_09695 [Pseudomonadota bacterium]
MKMIAPIVFIALTACVSPCGETAKPAVLDLDTDDNLSGVVAALASAEGRTSLALGPPDPRLEPVVTVLPPAPTNAETRSLALPSAYDIRLENGECVLRRQSDNLQVVLPRDIPCTPYQP